MLKYELSTALKSKRVMALFCFFILIIAYDLYSNYMENFGEYLRVGGSKPTGSSIMHPCFASFLTAANRGHYKFRHHHARNKKSPCGQGLFGQAEA